MGPAQGSHAKSPIQPVIWLRGESHQFPAHLQSECGQSNTRLGTDNLSMTSGSRSRRPTESSDAR